MVGPEAFTELKVLQNEKYLQALKYIPEVSEQYKAQFGHDSGGLVRSYRTEDADFAVVAMGSVNGTIKDTIDELRDDGLKVGLVTVVTYRPFPAEALRHALKGFKQVLVIDRAFTYTQGGFLAADIEVAVRSLPHQPQVLSVVAGLGGRPVTRASLKAVFHKVKKEPWQGMHFLDLNQQIVDEELVHMNNVRQSGPMAENIIARMMKNNPTV